VKICQEEPKLRKMKTKINKESKHNIHIQLTQNKIPSAYMTSLRPSMKRKEKKTVAKSQ